MNWIRNSHNPPNEPKILVPKTVGRVGPGFPPELQLVQIFYGYLALTSSFKQMVSQIRRQVGPLAALWLSGCGAEKKPVAAPLPAVAPALNGIRVNDIHSQLNAALVTSGALLSSVPAVPGF